MASKTRTVVRSAPQQVPAPSRYLLLKIGIGIVVLLLLAVALIFSGGDTPAVQPGQQTGIEAPPVVENPPGQDTTWATPEVELQWTKVGTARRNGDEAKLPLPWDKVFFISGPEIQKELKLPPDGVSIERDGTAFFNGSGYGDGTAFFITDWNGKYWFTPDRGTHWFKPANLYPGTSNTLPEPHGALLEGNTLVLFIALQSEPWVYTYWRAESPLVALEGPSR